MNFRCSTAVLAAAALAATFAISSSAGALADTAPPSDPDPTATADPDYSLVMAGDTYEGDEFDDASAAVFTTAAKRASSRIHANYNPIIIGLCNYGHETQEVTSFSSVNDGTVKMYCGYTLESGYNHIRDGHQNDWQIILNKYDQPGNWGDLMDFVTRGSLKKGYGAYPQDIGGQKACYSFPFKIENSNNKVLATHYPTIVISKNNKLVITSIPTHAQPSCKLR